jgi:hypothetical protein
LAAQASEATKSIEINVAESVDVALSEEQCTLLKRGIEQLLAALHVVEVEMEVTPDGTIRVSARLHA